MAYRKRRPACTVCVENIPMHVTEADVVKKFSSFGDIQSMFLKNGPTKTTNVAIIKFFSELDALKAVNEVNGRRWFNNVINARKCDKNGTQKKFEDKYNANKPKHMQSYQLYNFAPFPPVPNFVPNPIGNLFRGVAPRGYYFPYGPVHPKPVTNLSSISRPPNLQRLQYPEDRYMLCTFVEDIVTFYGQYAAKSNVLGQISSFLQQICPSQPRLMKAPDCGKLYAAVYSGDNLWYRCKVQHNRTPGKTFVQYIDYGNSEELEYRQLCELPESLRNQPCLAPKCVLVNLTPCNGNNSKLGLFYLQETILGQHLVVTTCSAEDSPVYEVSKCVCESKDIISQLVEHNYAFTKTPGPANGLTYNSPPSVTSNILPAPTKPAGSVAAVESRVPKDPLPPDRKGDEAEPKNIQAPVSPTVQANNEVEANGFHSPIPHGRENNEKEADTSLNHVPPIEMSAEVEVARSEDTSPEREVSNSSSPSLEERGSESDASSGLKSELDVLKKQFDALNAKCTKIEKDLEEKKAAVCVSKCNVFLKMESIARHLQKVNSFRNSALMDDSLVVSTFTLLRKADAIITRPQQELQNKLQEAFTSYHESLRSVAQGKIEDLEKKNACRERLCICLGEYLAMYNDSVMQKLVEELNDALVKLESLERSSADAWLTKEISSLDELIKAYELSKASKKSLLYKAQSASDRAHKTFFDALTKFETAFVLCPTNSSDPNHQFFNNSSDVNFESSLTSFTSAVFELENALEYEIHILSLETKSDGKQGMSVIECLMNMVTEAVERVEEESEVLQRYSSQLHNFSSFSHLQPMVDQVCDIRKEISSIKSSLQEKLADKKALEEVKNCDKEAISNVDSAIVELQRTLHYAFVEEDYSLKFFAKSFEASFPELELEYPELMLTKYMNSGVMRPDMELEHFTCRELPGRLDVCYESSFAEKPVILKEFLIENEEKSKQLEDRILVWNAIESPNLVEVLVMFKKNNKHFYVMMPRMYSLCEEVNQELMVSSSKCCEVLKSVLHSLKTLHSHGIVYSMIHPSTVLLEKESVALDFMFEMAPRRPCDMEFRGIGFQAPELSQGAEASKASDMFSFGCLVLTLLFPDTKFETDILGCPHPENLKSGIERRLPPEDCAAIMSLVNPTIEDRPSAERLLNSNFLKHCKEYCVSSTTETKQEPLANGITPSMKSNGITSGKQNNAAPSILHQVSSLRKPLNCSAALPDSCVGAAAGLTSGTNSV